MPSMLITRLINASLTLSNGGMEGKNIKLLTRVRHTSAENGKLIFSIYVTESRVFKH